MKTLLSLLFVFTGLGAMGTHIVGGDVRYEQTGDDTYLITLTVYRDCGPDNVNETGFDQFASVGIYEGNVLIQNLLLNLSDAEVDNLSADLNNPCLTLPPEVCVERAVYTQTVTLPDSAIGYDLVYQRCCRNPSIVNIQFPDDSGATFWTQIPPTNVVVQNSSPLFNNLPPVALCANSALVFDHSATDLDGDELVYTFCDPMLGADAFDPSPSPPPPPPFLSVNWAVGFDSGYQITSSPAFSINPSTGLITGTPTAVGQYVFGVCVEEYRNGVLLSRTNRDFQFNVVICNGIQPPNFGVEEECSGLTVQFDNYSNPDNEWMWDFGVSGIETDVATTFEPSFEFPAYGTYDVSLVINPGTTCSDTVTIPIQVISEDPITLQYSYAVPGPCSLSTEVHMQYTGDGADEIVWDLGDGTVETGDDVYYTYANFGTYELSVTGYNYFCDYQETATFELSFQNYLVLEGLVLPNVFSPNNDGKNDVFLPFFADENENPISLPQERSTFDYLDEWEIRIYNRWGALVFENSSIQPGWDGKIDGEPVSEGVYYCVIRFKKRCDEGAATIIEHDFTLMR